MVTKRLDSEELESILFNCIIERAPCKLGDDLSDLKDYSGRTLLHLVTELNLKEETEYLLSFIDPNVADDEGRRPLHYTSNPEIAALLLKYGADPNARDNRGRTPLHYAAERGHAKIVQLLLEHGADPNARDADGNTTLHLAASKEVVELLLKYGADPNVRNNKGLPPIHLAVTRNCESAVVLYDVTDKDALLVKDEEEETLLHLATASGCTKLIEKLMGYIDVNAPNAEGNTPLHIAAIYKFPEITKMLIIRGANPLIKNKYGTSPLMLMALAIKDGHPFVEAISLILKRFDVKIDEILRYAYNTEQLRLLQLLLSHCHCAEIQI
jgi:ankyrin repeat protein